MFARFMPSDFRDPTGEKPPAAANRVPQFMPPAAATAMEHEASVGVGLQQSGAFSSCAAEMLYRSHQQQLPSQSSASAAASLESSYGGVARSMAMGQQQAKSSANCSNLIRHSSSPAGLFVNPENGYGVMRGMGGFRPGSNGDPAVGGSRLKGQISFSSRQGSSTGLMMSQISELGGEGIGGSSPEDNGGGGCHRYISGYPVASWEDPSLLSDSFSALKRGGRDVNPSSEAQNGDVRNHVLGLSHQFSFPKTSSEMAAVEKLLQFQDSVPCKIRAKRGCATHPRSIAERVRRTRISERMRKLQELVPNMEKQTNTADMLDLAVEYIKDLRKQVKGLSDSRANCTCCSNKQKPYSSSPAV